MKTKQYMWAVRSASLQNIVCLHLAQSIAEFNHFVFIVPAQESNLGANRSGWFSIVLLHSSRLFDHQNLDLSSYRDETRHGSRQGEGHRYDIHRRNARSERY